MTSSATRPAPGWTATGLRWQGGRPELTARNGAREHARTVTTGTPVGWLVGGPRRCTGVRTSGGHHPCPFAAEIDPGGKAVQCPSCQDADPGLALARDQVLDNGRTYRLYLAWFGPGVLKVGITAERRGTTRLLEQAALGYTFVGRGPLPGVRRAELTVAQAGLARERLTTRTKCGGWWGVPDPAARRHELAELRAAVLRLLSGHAIELLADEPLADHVDLFGLGAGAPPLYQEVTALGEGAALAGTLRAPVGRHLFLDTGPTDPPLLLDTRLLTGWTLTAAGGRPCAGFESEPRRRPDDRGAQGALF
ncbi:DUF2797 domain-containing protein [Kitasatospora sp. NPDC057015]|uniref:DUF2797 domain-containing protein n=1 Tax=Kitasatospora sp. NPDC057015 TaxID=3346001 RepID=UPI003631AFAD